MALFEDLGKRYTALERPRDAERAYTSIVEAQASESESHTLLAGIREKQNRWADAIEQWEQVVRLRSLEPAGLFGLARAQVHEKQWDAARDIVPCKLDTTAWPPRFGDVHQQVRVIEDQIKAARDR